MFLRKSNSPLTLQLTLLLALLINHNQRNLVICSNNFSQIQGQSSNAQLTSTTTTTESPRYNPSQSGYSEDDISSNHQLSPQLSSSSSSLTSSTHSIKESRRSTPLHYGPSLISPRNDLLMAATSNPQQHLHHYQQQQQQQQQLQQPFMVRSGFGLNSGDFHSNGVSNGNPLSLHHQSSSPHHHHHQHSGSANFYSQRDLTSAGSSPADYTTSGAGFLMPDLQSEATSNRLYDLALASSENERIKATLSGRVRSSNGLSGSSSLSESSSSSGSSSSATDFSALDNNPSIGSSSSSQAESELANYLKAAASEAAASSSSPSAGGPSDNSNQLVQSSPNLVGRRKPLYAERVVEEQHIFDPAVTKHLLQKQRENEYAANTLMESGLSAESQVPSESDLAQQLAAMSELHSNHPGSSSASEYLPLSSSGLSLNPNSFSSINEYSALGGAGGPNGPGAAGLRGFSTLGGLSSIGGQGLATSAASSLPSMITPYALAAAGSINRNPAGVPAGAIVGAPGSAPPPGMKLAGYVTMTNPSPPMMSPQVSSSMVNPMALMAQNMGNNGQSMGAGGPGMASLTGGMSGNPQAQAVAQMMAQGMGQGMGQAMSQGMGQGMKYPFSPMAFGPGSAGQNQALQALLGGAMGQVGQQASQVSATTSSPAAATPGSASASTAPSTSSSSQSRNRFLSRLNPLNLFRRFRIRGNSAGSTSTEPSVAEAEKRSSVVSEYFSQGQQRFNRFPFHQHVGPHYTLYPYNNHPAFNHARRARRSTEDTLNNTQEKPVASEMNVAANQNDTDTAENYYPFPGNYFMPASGGRMRFPNSEGRRRGSRRYSGPGYLSSVENRGLGIMGSGNFEVIRGGILPGNKRTLRPHSSMANERDNDDRNDSGYSEEDDSHNANNSNNNSDDDKSSSYPPLEDEFFSAGSPGILGFQGFNHFSGSSSPAFNNLSASRRKSAILTGEKGSEALASEKSSTSTDLQAIS